MTRLRPFWRLSVRGLLLALVTVFALRLTLAEIHYARGWNRDADKQNLAELQWARAYYPLVRPFRDGPDLWEWVLKQTSK